MDFLLLLKIVVTAYFLAVNVFGFILINFQQKSQTAVQIKNEQPSNEIITKVETLNQTNESSTNQSLHQKTEPKKEKKIGSTKLFVTGLVGGAIGIYVAMLIYKYKLSNFFLMVVMPVFIAINLFFFVSALANGFWITTVMNG